MSENEITNQKAIKQQNKTIDKKQKDNYMSLWDRFKNVLAKIFPTIARWIEERGLSKVEKQEMAKAAVEIAKKEIETERNNKTKENVYVASKKIEVLKNKNLETNKDKILALADLCYQTGKTFNVKTKEGALQFEKEGMDVTIKYVNAEFKTAEDKEKDVKTYSFNRATEGGIYYLNEKGKRNIESEFGIEHIINMMNNSKDIFDKNNLFFGVNDVIINSQSSEITNQEQQFDNPAINIDMDAQNSRKDTEQELNEKLGMDLKPELLTYFNLNPEILNSMNENNLTIDDLVCIGEKNIFVAGESNLSRQSEPIYVFKSDFLKALENPLNYQSIDGKIIFPVIADKELENYIISFNNDILQEYNIDTNVIIERKSKEEILQFIENNAKEEPNLNNQKPEEAYEFEEDNVPEEFEVIENNGNFEPYYEEPNRSEEEPEVPPIDLFDQPSKSDEIQEIIPETFSNDIVNSFEEEQKEQITEQQPKNLSEILDNAEKEKEKLKEEALKDAKNIKKSYTKKETHYRTGQAKNGKDLIKGVITNGENRREENEVHVKNDGEER